MNLSFFEFGNDWNWGYFIFFFIVSVIVTALCKKGIQCGSEQDKSFFFSIVFIILFSLEAFRTVNVGSDTVRYVEYFNGVHNTGLSYAYARGFEPMFALYIYGLTRITNNYTILFVLNALLTTSAFVKYVKTFWKENDSYIFLMLFVVNYQYNLSAMRSSIATAFILYSIVMIQEKKYIKAIMLAVFAALFHNTALIHLALVIGFIFFIHKKSITKPWKLIAGSLIFFIVINVSTMYLQNFFSDTRYKGYVRNLGSSWLGYWFIYLSSFLVVWLLIQRKKKGNSSISVEEAFTLFEFALVPAFVKLNAYRVPKYYLLCRCGVYRTCANEVEKAQKSSKDVTFIKMGELFIAILYLLFYFSRITSGMTYEMIF